MSIPPAEANSGAGEATAAAPSRPAVVLVRPRESGNIGAVARAMANTGLERLILVDAPEPLGTDAHRFAVGAAHILTAAERRPSLREAVAPFVRVVGTTSTRDRALEPTLVSARDLPRALGTVSAGGGGGTALVFGSEVSGLRNEELALCSPIVQIPSSARQPTYNLAQAVLIVCYELFVGARALASPRAEPAPAGDIDRLFDQLAPLLRRIGFARDDSFDGVVRDLRQLSARALPTSREVKILQGICRRAGHALPPGE